MRYFRPYEGVQVKLVDFQEQSGGKSDIIVKYLTKILNEYNLKAKIVAFCRDNAMVIIRDEVSITYLEN